MCAYLCARVHVRARVCARTCLRLCVLALSRVRVYVHVCGFGSGASVTPRVHQHVLPLPSPLGSVPNVSLEHATEPFDSTDAQLAPCTSFKTPGVPGQGRIMGHFVVTPPRIDSGCTHRGQEETNAGSKKGTNRHNNGVQAVFISTQPTISFQSGSKAFAPSQEVSKVSELRQTAKKRSSTKVGQLAVPAASHQRGGGVETRGPNTWSLNPKSVLLNQFFCPPEEFFSAWFRPKLAVGFGWVCNFGGNYPGRLNSIFE